MKTLQSLFLLLLLMVSSAQAQIRSNWFDINPNQSGLDPSDPNGASGGRVHSIGAFADMSLVFVASEWGGLWSSLDQGNNWFRVRSYQPSAMFDVKVAARTDVAGRGTIYASSAYDGRVGINTAGNAITQSGLAFSRDRGASWLTVPLPPGPCIGGILRDEPTGWNIAIRPTNSREVFVGTNCGLLVTLNSGITWNYIDPSPADGVFEPVFAVVTPGNQGIAVISQNGFFSSPDNGVTWVQGGAGVIPGGFADLAVSPYEPNVLYAAQNGVVRESVDGGATWPTLIALPAGAGVGRSSFISTNRRAQNQYDLWYGGVRLHRTNCNAQVPPVVGGAARVTINWSGDLSKARGAHNDMGEVFFDPRTATDACPMLVASDGGVYRNTDLGGGCQTPSWEQPNVSPHGLWLFGFDGMIGSNGADQIYFGLQDNGVWGTTNAPRGPTNPWPIWDNEFCCDGFGVAVRPGEVHDVEGFYSSAARGFQLHRSGEGFSGKGDINTYPTSIGVLTFTSGRAIVSFGANSLALTMADRNVFVSTNMNSGSINWTPLGFPVTSFTGNGGLKASVSRRSPVFFYHSGFGRPFDLGDIAYYNGAAAGNTWNTVTRPTGFQGFTVYDVDPNNCNRMMASAIDAAGNFSTFRTDDLGSTWTNMPMLDNLMVGNGAFKNNSSSGPQDFYPNRGQVWQPYMFEINPVNSNIAVAGAADAGIFLTTDFGNNWVPLTNPTNPTSLASVGVNVAPHIPRPLFAWFGPSTFTSNTTAFDVWIGSQGGGIHKFLIESP